MMVLRKIQLWSLCDDGGDDDNDDKKDYVYDCRHVNVKNIDDSIKASLALKG